MTEASMTNARTLSADQKKPLFDRALIDALPVEHLCDLSIDLELGQVISTPLGTRLTFVVKGGRFEGPRFRGEMLPGGGDWVSLGADGTSRMDVRATMRTHDGVLIHYESHGVLRYPPRWPSASGERRTVVLRRELCAADAQVRDVRRALRVALWKRDRWLR
jgi:Protein of unknown function (DUF3237)